MYSHASFANYAARVARSVQKGVNSMNCAACSSPDIVSFPVAYEAGMSFSKGRVAGVGVGLGGGVGLGVGSTRGVSQSALSARLSPPKKGSVGGYVVAAIVCVALTAVSPAWLIGAVIFGLAAYGQSQKNEKEWKPALETWRSSFFCNRCGWMGRPIGEMRVVSGGDAIAHDNHPQLAPGIAALANASNAGDVSDALGRLAKLHEDGKLTDDEFREAKRRLLGG